MKTNYIEFTTDDKHASIGHCVSRLMTMLHGFMRSNEMNLGVAFPGMKDDFIGEKVRVFGSTEQLNLVLSNEQIQDACKRSICSMSVFIPTPVPTDSKAVRYCRSTERTTNIKSQLNRKLAKYKKYHNQDMPIDIQLNVKLNLVNKKSTSSAYFTVKQGDSKFVINVYRTDGGSGICNSYGLNSTVYDF